MGPLYLPSYWMVVLRKGIATVSACSEPDGSYQAITRLWCFEGGPGTAEHLGVWGLAQGRRRESPAVMTRAAPSLLGDRNLSKLTLSG